MNAASHNKAALDGVRLDFIVLLAWMNLNNIGLKAVNVNWGSNGRQNQTSGNQPLQRVKFDEQPSSPLQGLNDTGCVIEVER